MYFVLSEVLRIMTILELVPAHRNARPKQTKRENEGKYTWKGIQMKVHDQAGVLLVEVQCLLVSSSWTSLFRCRAQSTFRQQLVRMYVLLSPSRACSSLQSLTVCGFVICQTCLSVPSQDSQATTTRRRSLDRSTTHLKENVQCRT